MKRPERRDIRLGRAPGGFLAATFGNNHVPTSLPPPPTPRYYRPYRKFRPASSPLETVPPEWAHIRPRITCIVRVRLVIPPRVLTAVHTPCGPLPFSFSW